MAKSKVKPTIGQIVNDEMGKVAAIYLEISAKNLLDLGGNHDRYALANAQAIIAQALSSLEVRLSLAQRIEARCRKEKAI